MPSASIRSLAASARSRASSAFRRIARPAASEISYSLVNCFQSALASLERCAGGRPFRFMLRPHFFKGEPSHFFKAFPSFHSRASHPTVGGYGALEIDPPFPGGVSRPRHDTHTLGNGGQLPRVHRAPAPRALPGHRLCPAESGTRAGRRCCGSVLRTAVHVHAFLALSCPLGGVSDSLPATISGGPHTLMAPRAADSGTSPPAVGPRPRLVRGCQAESGASAAATPARGPRA